MSPRSTMARKGSTKARVLPDPVLEMPNTSWPDITSGHAVAWMPDGLPSAPNFVASADTMSFGNPMSLAAAKLVAGSAPLPSADSIWT